MGRRGRPKRGAQPALCGKLRRVLCASSIAQARTRRNRLNAERPYWEQAIDRFGGNVTSIAAHIGCGVEAARAAIWDLGMWPILIQARVTPTTKDH